MAKLPNGLLQLLQQALLSHRHALRLNEENTDVLFNSAQVMITIAETMSESPSTTGAFTDNPVSLLQEALELLSSCFSRQEMLLEEQRMQFTDNQEGGVSLENKTSAGAAQPEAEASSDDEEGEQQSATIQMPTTPMDLVDTARSSLTALTLLVSLDGPSNLPTLASMAQALTDTKIPFYVSQLEQSEQAEVKEEVDLERAEFVAALAIADCRAGSITIDDFLSRLQVFEGLDLNTNVGAMCIYADALVEFVSNLLLSRIVPKAHNPAQICWTQLSRAQDLYGKAVKINTEEAQERKAQIYEARGDVEMLRFRLATSSGESLSASTKASAPTLIKNAQTYYRGATGHYRVTGDEPAAVKAEIRGLVAAVVGGMASEMAKEPLLAPLLQKGTDAHAVMADMMGEGLLGEDFEQIIA